MRKIFFSLLVLLAVVATGAEAQTETLLTTITATAKEQASYSTANVATVSFSYTAYGSSAYLANWGWWGYGWSATVNAAEGYTITKCIFYDDANRTATDSEAPFVVETTEEDKTPRINGTPIDGGNMWSKGIKKIEVYGYENPTTVNVTGITLSQTEAAMTVGGETLTLTATVAPDDATDKTVTWTSSDPTVATVANGVVTAVAAGTATITATATNGTDDTTDDKTATCTITVTDPDQEAADAVVALFDALPVADAVTLDDKTAIEAARAAYEALTDDQKALVTPEDLAKLTAAEQALAALETTGVENVQTNQVQATKFFRDGMLLIEKNGKIYNAQGAEVK
ncbi:MAG: Ig domain-containing protein [Prevotella sp.]|nr:Ig domain-containing protein [Prevotella sp.]